MSRSEIKDLREERAKVLADAQDITEAARKADRDLTGEEAQKVDELLAEESRLKEDIDRREADMQRAKKIEDGLASLEQPGTQRQADRDPAAQQQRAPGSGASKEDRDRAIGRWVRYGMAGLDTEQRAIMGGLRTELDPEMEQRAMATDPGSAGGFTIPEDTSLYAAIVQGLQQFGGMRTAVERGGGLIMSTTGGNLPIPTDDDQELGELLGENTPANEQDVVVGQTVLSAYIYSSKMVRASVPFLNDSALDTDAWLGGILGRRLGRIFNNHQTLGDGTDKPLGLVPGVTNTVTAGAAAAISDDDLTNIEHAVDPAYRSMPGCGYMFNDGTLKAVKLLKDSEGRRLFQPGIDVAAPDTINGYRYDINQDMAAIAANAKSMAFGDFGRYRIREVRGITMMRLTERFAEYWQVAFLGWARMDSHPVDPGDRGLAILTHPAT